MTMNKGQPPAGNLAAAGQGERAPSDIELMQYFDGELEEPRNSVVAAFVRQDRKAQNKLAGLQITGAILQNEAFGHSAADGIADLVMAKISAETRSAVAEPPAQAQPSPIHLAARAPANAAANDNSRRLFAVFGALAVAAAAVLAIWSRSGDSAVAPSTSQPVAVFTAPSTLSAPKTAQPEIDSASLAADAAESDAEHGVEVAAVNFGTHMGSIFYVPSGSIEAKRATTVVWLADDAGE